MKKIIQIKHKLIIPILLVLMGCSMPDLFDSGAENYRSGSTSDYTMILVKKTGKGSESGQVLTVLNNGEASLENYHNARLIRTQLSDTELQAIQNVFIDNKFFFLDEKYLLSESENIQYTITFQQANLKHTIVTGYSAAPAELKKIILEVDKLAAQIAEWNLELKVEVNKTTLTQGDTLVMVLYVHNKSAFPLNLNFKNRKIYNFWIVKNAAGDPRQQEVVWELDPATGSKTADPETVMKAGETRIYQERWHGKNKAGNPVTGKFLVFAELLSTPGGIAAEIPVEISSARLVNTVRVTYGDSLELSLSISDTVFSLPAEISFTMAGKNISNSRAIRVPIDPASYDLIVSYRIENNIEILWEMTKPERHRGPDWPFLRLEHGQQDTIKATWQIRGPMTAFLPKGLYHIQGRLYNKDIGMLRMRIK